MGRKKSGKKASIKKLTGIKSNDSTFQCRTTETTQALQHDEAGKKKFDGGFKLPGALLGDSNKIKSLNMPVCFDTRSYLSTRSRTSLPAHGLPLADTGRDHNMFLFPPRYSSKCKRETVAPSATTGFAMSSGEKKVHPSSEAHMYVLYNQSGLGHRRDVSDFQSGISVHGLSGALQTAGCDPTELDERKKSVLKSTEHSAIVNDGLSRIVVTCPNAHFHERAQCCSPSKAISASNKADHSTTANFSKRDEMENGDVVNDVGKSRAMYDPPREACMESSAIDQARFSTDFSHLPRSDGLPSTSSICSNAEEKGWKRSNVGSTIILELTQHLGANSPCFPHGNKLSSARSQVHVTQPDTFHDHRTVTSDNSVMIASSATMVKRGPKKFVDERSNNIGEGTSCWELLEQPDTLPSPCREDCGMKALHTIEVAAAKCSSNDSLHPATSTHFPASNDNLVGESLPGHNRSWLEPVLETRYVGLSAEITVPVAYQEFRQIGVSGDGISVGSTKTYSATCSRTRESGSSLSSHESVFAKDLKKVNITDLAERSVPVVAALSTRGTGFLEFLQHHLETAFYNEVGDLCEDDNEDSYEAWLELTKRPKILSHYEGHIWTKHWIEDDNDIATVDSDAFNAPQGALHESLTDEILPKKILPCEKPPNKGNGLCPHTGSSHDNRRRVAVNQHDWSDSDSDQSESRFLDATSRIRKNLHAVTILAAEKLLTDPALEVSNQHDVIEVDDFLRSEGITEDMIQGIHEREIDRYILEGRMFSDIAQAVAELDMEESDFESSEEDFKSDEANEIVARSAMGVKNFPSSVLKAKWLFVNSVKKRKADLVQQDESSLVTISSSENDHKSEESSTGILTEDVVKPQHDLLLSLYVPESDLKNDEEIKENESLTSLGSLGVYSTTDKKVEENYMFLEIDESTHIKVSRQKRVAFVVNEDSVDEYDSMVKDDERGGIARFLGRFRRPYHGVQSNVAYDELSNGLDDDNEHDIDIEKLICAEEECENRDWIYAVPDVRWDFTDRRDLFWSTLVDWDPPPLSFDNIDNHWIEVKDTLEKEVEGGYNHEEVIIPMAFLDIMYKKIPRRQRPYVVFFCFLAIVVLPISLGLSVVAVRSVINVESPNLIFTATPSHAPTSSFIFKNWTQVGPSLTSADENGQYGFSLSFSGDGTLLAIGARKSRCTGALKCGKVHIYEHQNLEAAPTWTLVQKLEGSAEGNQFGFSVAVSGDGRRIAVGSIGDDVHGRNSGLVQVFERNQGLWGSIYEFRGRDEFELFGASVGLSQNGRTLSVGAPHHSSNDKYQTGRVYFFEDIGFPEFPRWISSNGFLSGPYSGGWFGWSLSLSGDGTRIVIGAPGNPNLNVSGYARIYDFDGYNNKWLQRGEDLGFKELNDRYGYSVSICRSGERVAIGAFRSTIRNMEIGCVYTYEFRNKKFAELGHSLHGDSVGDDFGFSVALSSEGNHMAVGAPQHSTAFLNATSGKTAYGQGKVRIFEIEDLTWVASRDISPVAAGNGKLGFAVDLAMDASQVAVSLPLAGNGEVRVFE